MKHYQVIGSRAVFGYEPGRKFRRDIPRDQEKRLLGSGAIQVVEEQRQKVEPNKPTMPKPFAGLGNRTTVESKEEK